MGGLAEYCLVDANLATLKPDEVSAVDGAALSNSPCHALIAVDETKPKPTDRVLILGGTGGAGSALVQLVRNAGVAFVAATGTDTAMLATLGVDRPIDYTKENWWEIPEFQETKFDIIFDLAEGTLGWQRCGSVLKTSWAGGRYFAFILDDWDIFITSKIDMLKFSAQLLYRTVSTLALSIINAAPAYTMKISSPTGELLTRVCEFAREGRLKAVIVGGAPYPFTAAGAIAGFEMLKSRRAKGKVVFKVAD